jgi:translation initiation factor 1
MGRDRDHLVYSTETGDHRSKTNSPEASWTRGRGPVKLRLEKKGRGGKTVTVLFDLPWDEAEASQWLKRMQSTFGCGGTAKDSTLELRGDVLQRAREFLQKHAIPVK